MDNPDTEDDEKVHFRIGSALDCQLTSPELWDEKFLVIEATRPMGFMGKFIDNLPSGLDPLLSDISLYQEAYDKAGYKMSINKVIEKMWNTPELIHYYLSTRNIDKDKSVISKDEYEQVMKAKELLLANEFTERYFRTSEDTDGIYELLTQVPIYFRHLGEDCKALLDGILINHEAKTIQIYDLKTTGKSVYAFESAYLDYGYYRQIAFYSIALRHILELYPRLEGYLVLNPVFIVVETKLSSTHPAVIYEVKDREFGYLGGTVKGKRYKGIAELINAYKFHRDNDYWDMPKDLYDNKGVIELNVFDEEPKPFSTDTLIETI